MLLLIVLLSGCYTAKKAMRQDVKVQSQYPEISAANCAVWYPPRIESNTETKYIKGEEKIEYRTVQVDCDSAIIATGKNVIDVPCPGTKTRIDTLKVVTLQAVANVAKEAELLLKNEKLATENIKAETKLRGANKLNWVLGAFLALVAVWMFIKPKFL